MCFRFFTNKYEKVSTDSNELELSLFDSDSISFNIVKCIFLSKDCKVKKNLYSIQLHEDSIAFDTHKIKFEYISRFYHNETILKIYTFCKIENNKLVYDDSLTVIHIQFQTWQDLQHFMKILFKKIHSYKKKDTFNKKVMSFLHFKKLNLYRQ